MKIASKLTAEIAEDAEWHDIHGMRSSVHNEPRQGVIRILSLGDAGLVMRRGPVKAAIRLDALIELLEQIEPGLKCPPPPSMKSDDITKEDLNQLGG